MQNLLLEPTLDRPDKLRPGETILGCVRGVTFISRAGVYVRWCAGLEVDYLPAGKIDGPVWRRSDARVHVPGQAIESAKSTYIMVPGIVKEWLGGYCIGAPVEVCAITTRRFVRTVVADFVGVADVGVASAACAGAVGLVAPDGLLGEKRRVVHYVLHVSEAPAFAMPNSTQGHFG